MTKWVIKIGTSLLRGNDKYSTFDMINHYCAFISKAQKKGDRIILVSSGAVGLGCHKMSFKMRPKEIISLQASAAIGQLHLMSLYEEAMSKFGFNVAQILLTRSELGSRNSYKSASQTLKKLIEWDVIPIVNENDIISDEELKYGDNDTLSALVATAISADQLILLTDIDHLYSSDPKNDIQAKPIKDINNSAELNKLEITNKQTTWGTGGIKTKLTAAKIATESGIKVQLADGRDPEILGDLLDGKKVGTIFHPNPNPIGNRKSWLSHAIKPVGEIYLDDGASEAIKNKGASLLLVGVKKVSGNFISNQPVKVINTEGEEIAKGICSMSSDAIKIGINSKSSKTGSPLVIHRDVLVLTSE
tara:strand:- start:1294 stop:2376 length:1083 start_codon:yes stop_codon:yes gene_type:complete